MSEGTAYYDARREGETLAEYHQRMSNSAGPSPAMLAPMIVPAPPPNWATIPNENKSSVEISRNAKGEIQYQVKVYWDERVAGADLKAVAIAELLYDGIAAWAKTLVAA